MIEKMDGNPPTPPQREQVEEDQDLSADDAVEIIELEEGDGLDEGVGDLDLQDHFEDGQNGEGDSTEHYAYEEDEVETIDDMEIEDDSKISFEKHSGSVFCVSLNPTNQTLAISGNCNF